MSELFQLVAHADPDMRRLIGRTLKKALGLDAYYVEAGSIERARELALHNDEDNCSLVVVASTMPVDEESSIGLSGRDPTRQFIKELKAYWARLPVIVVSSTPDDRLAGFLDAYEKTAMVTADGNLAETLLERVRELHAQDGRRKPAFLQLDIQFFDDHRAATWQMRRTGRDEFSTSGPLQITEEALRRVRRESSALDREVASGSADWRETMSQLSTELQQLLFNGGAPNRKFWNTFLVHRDRVGGIGHTRIRLTVNDETHPLLVEALRDEEASDEDYWMLHAPVFRRYDYQTRFRPLFKDSMSRIGGIHCLVIEGDPEPGNVPQDNGESMSFERLAHCETEAQAVTAMLERGAGGTVQRLRVAELGDDVQGQVLEVLGRRQWHLVHFCGHACVDLHNEPCLVLRADRGGLLPLELLGRHLHRTQFLFLSSCHSTAGKAVLRAVEQHVPAVLGFRWQIEDAVAREFAQSFYELLFNPSESCHRYLEYAFMKARRRLYDQGPEQPSWAAPMLVMQMD